MDGWLKDTAAYLDLIISLLLVKLLINVHLQRTAPLSKPSLQTRRRTLREASGRRRGWRQKRHTLGVLNRLELLPSLLASISHSKHAHPVCTAHQWLTHTLTDSYVHQHTCLLTTRSTHTFTNTHVYWHTCSVHQHTRSVTHTFTNTHVDWHTFSPTRVDWHTRSLTHTVSETH